jgi:hypothetical protein
MPMKNPDALARTKRDARKRALVRHAPIAVFNEPKTDWVTLRLAPLCFTSNGYVSSVEMRGQALHGEVLQIISSHGLKNWECSLASINQRSDHWCVCIKKNAIEANIDHEGWISVRNLNEEPFFLDQLGGFSYRNLESVHGMPDSILDYREDWEVFPQDQQEDAFTVRHLLSCLFDTLHKHFVQALECGAAHIMARKNSVFAQFERVTWDQWQFFRLDADYDRPFRQSWGNPRSAQLSLGEQLGSAIGPAGERLFAIHVAPGLDISELPTGNDPPSSVPMMTVAPDSAPGSINAWIEGSEAETESGDQAGGGHAESQAPGRPRERLHRKQDKSSPALNRAHGVIDELYPRGVPAQAAEPNVILCRRVGERLKQAGLPGASNDTILRAAGRRRK